MTAAIRRAVMLTTLCLGLIAAGPRRVVVEIFIADSEDGLYDLADVTVTAEPSGETYTKPTAGPNSHVRFDLPGSTESIDVVVYDYDHDRYSCFEDIVIGGRGRVGGHGIFLELPNPCN